MTLNNAGEQFQIKFPLSTSNAWQKRDTSQDRDQRARCNKGHRTLNQGNMDVHMQHSHAHDEWDDKMVPAMS